MNYAKTFLAVSICGMLLMPSASIYAVDGLDENGLNQQSQSSSSESGDDKEGKSNTAESFNLFSANLNDIYSVMNTSVKGGENISLSEAFNQFSNFSISTEEYKDISDLNLGSTVDFGTVNLQYCNLAQNMVKNAQNNDLSGQSTDCLSLFENTFGDVLSSISLENPSIPEGFTVENMLSQGQSAIDCAYSSATSSGSFASVKNSISIGNIFSKASQGLSMPDLASDATLSNLISSSSASQKSKISGEYNDRRTWINEKRSDVKQNTLSNLNKNFLSAYDTYSKSDVPSLSGAGSSTNTSDKDEPESSQAEVANSYVTQALNDNNGKFNKDTVVTAYYYYVISSDNVAESTRNKVRTAGKNAFIENDANRLNAQTWYDSTQME